MMKKHWYTYFGSTPLWLPQRNQDLLILQAFADIRGKLRVPFDMKIIILVAWIIWIVRK
jgi:hypothetical protein